MNIHEAVSVEDFVTNLIEEGIVSYDIPCSNGYTSHVTLDGLSIREYLPLERRCSDGTVHVREASPGLLEMLKEGKDVEIYSHDGDVYRFTVTDGTVVFCSYERLL